MCANSLPLCNDKHMITNKQRAARLGAILSDLTAGIVALVTESERGETLAVRKLQLQASLKAMACFIDEWTE